MKSSTSWPSSSRKYSAIVRPDSATRMRAPGGSFIWPKTSIVLSMTPDSFISSQRSLPSRERSPTPQKADRPPCSWARLWISSWMMHRLADAGAAEQADLAALGVGREQVDDLDAGLEHLGGRRQVLDASAPSRWIGQRSMSSSISSPVVDRLAEQVEDAAERGLADGHGDRAAGVDDLHAAGQAVGACPWRPRARGRRRGAAAPRRPGRARAAGDPLLLRPGSLRALDRQRVVDLGQLVGEDGLDDDALDLLDPADVAARRRSLVSSVLLFGCDSFMAPGPSSAPRRRRRLP